VGTIGVANANAEGQWTFLEIVQQYVRDCGIASSANVDLPETVENQVGELKRAVINCREAWFDIQTRHRDWRFKRREFSFPTVDGQAEYSYAEAGIDPGTFGEFVLDSFRVYSTSPGLITEMEITNIPYSDWRSLYKLGANRSTKSQPQEWALTPSDGIALGPTPLAGYTILGDYYTGPIRMELDEDVPELPYKHSPMIIVYHAMTKYGFFEAAPEVVQIAKTEYRRLLGELERDQLDPIYHGGALA
jgi:hypothetical protein